MFNVGSLSRKLALSPRPRRRRLQRQKETTDLPCTMTSSFDAATAADVMSDADMRGSKSDCALDRMDRQHSLDLRDTFAEGRVSSMPEGREALRRPASLATTQPIKIVIQSPETPQQKTSNPMTSSLHVDPSLLSVGGASGSHFRLHSKSAPTSREASPPSSTSRASARRLSWIGRRSKSSPDASKRERVAHSNSFSSLLPGNRKSRPKFSLDRSMIEEGALYWVITVHTLKPGCEFDVSGLHVNKVWCSCITLFRETCGLIQIYSLAP